MSDWKTIWLCLSQRSSHCSFCFYEQTVVSRQGILFHGTNLPVRAQAKTAYNDFLVTVKKVITARMARKQSTIHGFLM